MNCEDLQRALDTTRFWKQIEGDAKRTLLCTVEDAPRVQEAVDRYNAGHVFTVLASPACPQGQIIVMDEAALQASANQALQRSMKNWRIW